MKKKSVLGLLLLSCVITSGMFYGTMFLMRQQAYLNSEQAHLKEDNKKDSDKSIDAIIEDEKAYADARNDNKNKTEEVDSSNKDEPEDKEDPKNSEENDEDDKTDSEETLGDNVAELPDLIGDSSQVDYMKYIPEMVIDSNIKKALDIKNPSLDINAKSAILIDVNTKRVLYYKDPVVPVFPASTAKLLTALVSLELCTQDEKVTVGDELDLVASDSTVANLRKGQVLTIRNLIEGMLLPSGNDAAYVLAAYVGKKSLGNKKAGIDESVPEFIRLMNKKAKGLGAVNSCFKTPDGYDAFGQYTTAYDMGMIGIAAARNKTIVEVCKQSSSTNKFLDGTEVTWRNTNALIRKDSGLYYSYCIGLKTGTTTMAGKCLISLAKKDDKQVLSVVMKSDSSGRWNDSIKLLDYGLSK